MNADLEPLIALQTLDLRINELSDQQRKIPAHLEAAEVPLRDAKTKLDQAKTSLEVSLKERRDRERDLDVQEAQVEKFRARLTELKTNKEYQAALFEIEMANKRKRDIEDGLLVLMETVEKWQAQVKDGERLAQETEAAFQAKKQELDAAQASLTAELAQLGEHQNAKMAGISKGLLDRYRRLKAGKKDLALVPVRNGICSGCRLQLPPQLVAEVKRGDALQSCSYCQRILFYEGDPGAHTGPAAESPSLAATGKSSD